MSSEDKYYLINGTLIHADQFNELYHAGRLGMKWGKHLPGTDWWKESVNTYYSQHPNVQSVSGGRRYAAQPTLTTKIKANISTAGKAAKNYARLAKGTAKAYGASARVAVKSAAKNVSNRASYAAYKVKRNVSDSARKAYAGVRDSVHKFFESGNKDYKHTHVEKYTSLTHLEQLMQKEQREAAHAYVTSKVNGGVGNTINTFIQSAQMKFAVGVNQFLKNQRMTQKVDKFLSKFFGDSGYAKEQKKKAKIKNMKPMVSKPRSNNMSK